jgi:hydroxyethylthiazole kinase-like uncharacterized protein yjeF
VSLALFRAVDIRRIEAQAAETLNADPLMARAGRATADLAARLAADSGKAVLVAAGPGNNGGDAWVAAAHLLDSFHRVTVVDLGPAEPKAPEARAAKARFAQNGGASVRAWPTACDASLIVDGLLGIGLTRDTEGPIAEAIERINALSTPVLAIDVPSGLDADTGAVRGCAVRATHTLTFIGLKAGLYTADGVDHAGRIHLDGLGLPAAMTASAPGTLITPEAVRGWLAPRARNAHKGTYRTLGIVGGNKGMTGAALLAARAGLFTGAGKVFVGLLAADAPAFDPLAPELMLRPVDDALAADVIVAGPGAGLSPSATSRSAFERSLLPATIASARPLVLDADALNAIALQEALQTAIAQRRAPTILTPHPGEAARLLRSTTEQVQKDRIGAAVEIAKRYRAQVVLKGAGSVVASPDGHWAINTTGNPGLASGGTGDALAGMIGALLCQGLDAGRALAYAVCLHGAAADACVARGVGPAGLTASDVILEARALLNSWSKN